MDNIRFAVDLGTTNIEVAMICDDNQSFIADKIIKNRQSLYGSDVINRISATIKNNKLLDTMRNMVLSDLQSVFEEMLSANGYNAEMVDRICICGNTTMISILLGYDISGLGSYPFKHKLSKSIVCASEDLFPGLFKNNTKVILSGCAGPFIGGDILSGIYYLLNNYPLSFDSDSNSLFIDMGTNGEMILFSKGKYFGTSTACGPAFEGCTRRQSVYGYSTIDAISLGINAGRIKRNGTFADLASDGITISGVRLDSDILENIILAKAGIYTGIKLLMDYAKVTSDMVDNVYIAGGFGFNLNIDSAINIGLLPEIFKDKITVVGNTSLKGAALLLESCSGQILPIDEYNIDILQLANDDSFRMELVNNLSFARK